MSAIRVPVRGKSRVSREKRDQIVLDHLPLVRAIAIRVHENLPVHVDLDDLIHAGVMGLFDAVTKYDGAKNVAFQAYAKHRIKGAILDSLREMDWASRDVRRRQKRIEAITQDLAGQLGRSPYETEVAERMGVSMKRWRHIQMEMRTLGPVSASPDPEHDREQQQEFPADGGLRPDRLCEQQEMHTTLARAIGTLPKRYQKVVFLYYTNDLTMKEIGEVLGVNESRVSQIHKVALQKMAGVLQSEGISGVRALAN